MSFKYCILLSLVFLIEQSFACKPTAPSEMNLHVDLDKGIHRFYTSKRLLDERPSLSIDSCRNTAASRKFIMLGLGIENLVLTNETIGFNYTPQEESLECKLNNNPYKLVETKSHRFAKLKAKREFFNRCVVVQVTELNPNIGLQYPEEQPGCEIKKVSKWSVDFSGPYCFFKPLPESNYSVHLDIKQECRTQEGLSQVPTDLGDYNALLNTYISGDASGFSADLTALSTTSIRLSMGAPSSLLKISDDFGAERPRWPTEWRASDLFLGELSIHTAGDLYDEITLPLVANTICERKCKDNLCASPCDYAQPVVGEFSLYEIVKGKREFMSLWYDGSVASAQYQGLLVGMGQTLPRGTLETGRIYEIEASFREPDLDFAYFSGRVKNELRFRRNYIGPLARTGQINLVPLINTISRPGDIPEVPLIRNLSFDNSELDGLSRALSTWQSKLDNVFWPPFYEEMCAQEGSCEKAGDGYVTLKVKFTLEDNGSGGFKVNTLGGERLSNIVENRTWAAGKEARVDCGINVDSDDSDDDFDWGDIL